MRVMQGIMTTNERWSDRLQMRTIDALVRTSRHRTGGGVLGWLAIDAAGKASGGPQCVLQHANQQTPRTDEARKNQLVATRSNLLFNIILCRAVGSAIITTLVPATHLHLCRSSKFHRPSGFYDQFNRSHADLRKVSPPITNRTTTHASTEDSPSRGELICLNARHVKLRKGHFQYGQRV